MEVKHNEARASISHGPTLSPQVDFTKCRGFFCVLGIVVFVTGIITVIVLSFKYVSLNFSANPSSDANFHVGLL